jgi:hypothetical protein
MKKLIPMVPVLFFSITAFGQIKGAKNQQDPFAAKFDPNRSVYMKSGSGEELKTDSTINLSWLDGAFMNSNRNIYEYDSDRNLARITYYNWDNAGEKWGLSFNEEYTYDMNGNLISQVNNNWDEGTSGLVRGARISYFKDQTGRDTLVVNSSWSKGMEQWVDGMKKVLTYDSTGNLALSVLYLVNIENTGFDTTMKTEFYNDANGADTSHWDSFWDVSTHQWSLTNKTDTYYNNTGKDTLLNYFNWNVESSIWNISMKIEKSYDAKGRDSVQTRSQWDQYGSKWIPDYKAESLYDNSNNTVMDQYMGTEEGWQLLSELTTYRSRFTLSGTGNSSLTPIRLYPNPARDFIRIDMKDVPASATLEIYNIQGSRMLDQQIQGGRQIDITALPGGLYIYKITGNGIRTTGKLVIE